MNKAVATQDHGHDFLQHIVNLKSITIILSFISYVFLVI